MQVESVATSAWSATASKVITKPTGLEVGDTLYAVIASAVDATPASTVATPAGWTADVVTAENYTNFPSVGLFRKTATADDVSATDFTFTSANADHMAGVLCRISGEVGYFATDLDEKTTDTAPNTPVSAVKDVDVPIADCIVLSIFTGRGPVEGTLSFGTYTLTGGTAVTLTERIETIDGSAFEYYLALADGKHDAIGTITATGVTPTVAGGSDVDVRTISNRLVILTEAQDGIGTTALLTSSPTFSAPTPSVTASGTADLLTASPIFPAPASEVPTPKWTNTDKSSVSTVTNLDKS